MTEVKLIGGPLDGFVDQVADGPLAVGSWEGEVGFELLAPGDRLEYREHRYHTTRRRDSQGRKILEYVWPKINGGSE